MDNQDERETLNLDSSTMSDSSSPRAFIAGLKPPSRLTLGANIQESWKLFKQRWDTYAVLSQVSTLQRNVQVALFLHCLDDDALKAYNGFSFVTPESDRTVSDIIAKFESFAIGEVNETYERFIFNNRAQRDGESFERFYSEIRRLVKSCNHCDKCLDSILRDRIVLGVRDKDTQRDLLKIRDLTLAKAIDVCKAAENADRHRRTMNMPSHAATAVNAVPKAKHQPRSAEAPRAAQSHQSATCKFCGRRHQMLKSKCPAYGKECSKCHGRNHFASVCKSSRKPKINNLEPSDSESEPDWVNTVHDRRTKLVRCKMVINGRPVAFLIDSGASVNVLPKKYAKNLVPSSTSLTSFGGSTLSCVGKTRETLKNTRTKKKFNVEFVVCERDVQPVLGLRAAEQMNLLSLQDDNFEEVFSLSSLDGLSVFKDELGQFPGQQHLTTDPSVKPVIMPNRRVPVAVKDRLKQELDRLTEIGVITPVTEPTPWVSQIVVAHKKNGQLRVCIDPKFLNKALRREHYTMPLLDDVLHELSESRVFTKVDLRNGFWHVLLDTESSLLTTFQTCYGRYRWLRLPFGLSVSSEIFQRKILELFGALPGVVAIHDDVIIHGRNQHEHDLNLQRFIAACGKYGVRLNKDKLELASDKITFMGHVISSDGIRTDSEKVKAIRDFPQPTCLTEVRKSNDDPNIGLLNLRNTPSEGLTSSPAQRLMGRRTQTIIPATDSALKRPSKIPVSDKMKMDSKKLNMSQKNINRPSLGPLSKGDIVRMQPIDNTKEWKEARVTKTLDHNTFEVFDGSKFFRRNRQFLRKRKSHLPIRSTPSPTSERLPQSTVISPKLRVRANETQKDANQNRDLDKLLRAEPDTIGKSKPLTTRSGRAIKQPDKLVIIPGASQRY